MNILCLLIELFVSNCYFQTFLQQKLILKNSCRIYQIKMSGHNYNKLIILIYINNSVHLLKTLKQFQQSYKNMQTVCLGLGLSQHQFKLIIITIMALLSLLMLKRKKQQPKSILIENNSKEDVDNISKNQFPNIQQNKNYLESSFKTQQKLKILPTSEQNLKNLSPQNISRVIHDNLQIYRNISFKNVLITDKNYKAIQKNEDNNISNASNSLKQSKAQQSNQQSSQKIQIESQKKQCQKKYKKIWDTPQEPSVFKNTIYSNNTYGLNQQIQKMEIERIPYKYQNSQEDFSQNNHQFHNPNQTERQNFVQSKAKFLLDQISSNLMSNQEYFRKYCPELFVQQQQQNQVFFDIKMEQQENQYIESQMENQNKNQYQNQDSLQTKLQKNLENLIINDSQTHQSQKNKKHIPEIKQQSSKFNKNLIKRRRVILKRKNLRNSSSKLNSSKFAEQKKEWLQKFQILAIQKLYQLIKQKKKALKQKKRKGQQIKKHSKKQN